MGKGQSLRRSYDKGGCSMIDVHGLRYEKHVHLKLSMGAVARHVAHL